MVEREEGAIEVVGPASDTELAHLARAAERTARNAVPENTRRAYAGDWARFVAWCSGHGLEPLPATPETVRLYVEHLAAQGSGVSTIRRAMAAIAKAHELAPDSPLSPTHHASVKQALRGKARELGGSRPKDALPLAAVRTFVEQHSGSDPRAVLDRALLCFGFMFAGRRSELAGINHEHLSFDERGVVVFVPKSKTDQEGKGAYVGVRVRGDEVCGFSALRRWIEVARVTSGPVFRRLSRSGDDILGERLPDHDVWEVVKRCAAGAGLDPKRFGAHSLRAGFITAAHVAGVPEATIMQHTRHKSVAVFRDYIRRAELLDDDNPTGKIGL